MPKAQVYIKKLLKKGKNDNQLGEGGGVISQLGGGPLPSLGCTNITGPRPTSQPDPCHYIGYRM